MQVITSEPAGSLPLQRGGCAPYRVARKTAGVVGAALGGVVGVPVGSVRGAFQALQTEDAVSESAVRRVRGVGSLVGAAGCSVAGYQLAGLAGAFAGVLVGPILGAVAVSALAGGFEGLLASFQGGVKGAVEGARRGYKLGTTAVDIIAGKRKPEPEPPPPASTTPGPGDPQYDAQLAELKRRYPGDKMTQAQVREYLTEMFD
ncbi:MAG: hypothetical protein AB1758_36990 [Candidatus Eremiobacterota bacterium]